MPVPPETAPATGLPEYVETVKAPSPVPVAVSPLTAAVTAPEGDADDRSAKTWLLREVLAAADPVPA